MIPLNQTDYVILEEIGRAIRDSGMSPTLRELVANCDLSSTSVSKYHVGRLHDAGMITSIERKARSIQLTDAGKKVLGITATLSPIDPPFDAFHFQIACPPSVNSLHELTFRRNKEGQIKPSRANNAKYDAWMTEAQFSLRTRFNRQGRQMITGLVAVRTFWHLPSKRADMPNYPKALYDAMQGIVYLDDVQIVQEFNQRGADNPKDPTVEVWVWGL